MKLKLADHEIDCSGAYRMQRLDGLWYVLGGNMLCQVPSEGEAQAVLAMLIAKAAAMSEEEAD